MHQHENYKKTTSDRVWKSVGSKLEKPVCYALILVEFLAVTFLIHKYYSNTNPFLSLFSSTFFHSLSYFNNINKQHSCTFSIVLINGSFYYLFRFCLRSFSLFLLFLCVIVSVGTCTIFIIFCCLVEIKFLSLGFWDYGFCSICDLFY